MVEFDQVTKRYFDLTALKDITLSIPQGEVIGLLGPNGAGKTTLIKLIAGLVYPTSGELRVSRPGWPTIGFKPERLVFPGNMRVSQYLELVSGLCSENRTEREGMVLESLARVNLLGVANKQIKTLSKGMRQRLGLAQAITGEPSLLLLDEPTSGLDPEGQSEILSYVEELRRVGRTIIMSSHQLHEVTQVCTSLIILKEGKLHYQNRLADALALQPHVVIQCDRDPSEIRPLLTMVHPDVEIEGHNVILRHEATRMRRQILTVLINQGFDILGLEQRRATLAEIYAEAVQ